MVYLIIDAGNTLVKVFVFEEDNILFNVVCEEVSLQEIFEEIFFNFSITNIILSSVGALKERIESFIEGKGQILVLSNETKVPFKNSYKTPKTLGVDRIALVTAAITSYPNKNVLVIDAGTCVTFDFVNNNQEYIGGAISLGLQMRYKALHAFTEKLPELNFKSPENLVGVDTQTSIHSGVVNGLVAEIKGVIEEYEQVFSNLIVVLTGGDMNYLSKRLKNSIFANPNFLVEGLNAILKHNAH